MQADGSRTSCQNKKKIEREKREKKSKQNKSVTHWSDLLIASVQGTEDFNWWFICVDSTSVNVSKERYPPFQAASNNLITVIHAHIQHLNISRNYHSSWVEFQRKLIHNFGHFIY